MAIVLTAVAVVAGLLLGYVNQVTAEPIAQANAKALSDAIALVVPGFDNEPAANPDTVEVDGVNYVVYRRRREANSSELRWNHLPMDLVGH